MDISVVIPAYNSSRTIYCCVKSVYDELCSINLLWEIIVINDGSTDNTLEKIIFLINELASDRIIVLSQINKGAAEARNAGLKIAQGRLIAFNDSDDVWLPGKLKLQMSVLKDDPTIDMIGGLHGGERLKIMGRKMDFMYEISFRQMLIKYYFPTPGVVFKKELLEKVGDFPEGRRNAEEGSFFYKMTYYGRCVLINKMLTENVLKKHQIGIAGLSGQIHKQAIGELHNIKILYRDGLLGVGGFVIVYVYNILKYIRRVIFHYFRKIKTI